MGKSWPLVTALVKISTLTVRPVKSQQIGNVWTVQLALVKDPLLLTRALSRRGWDLNCEDCEPYPMRPLCNLHTGETIEQLLDQRRWYVPKFKFVECPNALACNGSDVTEMCNEDMGYLDQCCQNETDSEQYDRIC